jgi:hypothetical protein
MSKGYKGRRRKLSEHDAGRNRHDRAYAWALKRQRLTNKTRSGKVGTRRPAGRGPMSRSRARLLLIVVITVGVLTVIAALIATGDGRPPPAAAHGLTVAPAVPVTGYDRDVFGTWGDMDRDGCDTRAEVLQRDMSAETVYPGCRVTRGYFIDSYTNARGWTPASSLDVDHVVALADAWRSGAHKWSPARRWHFANDERNLRLTIAYVNRRKGDLGPDRWQPWTGGRCAYADAYRDTKARWGLTVTRAQHEALAVQLAACTREGATTK